MSIRPYRDIVRRKSRKIRVGSVEVGGDAPITVQSMTITKTADVEGTLQQIYALAAAGCDIVRCTCNEAEAAEGFVHAGLVADERAVAVRLVLPLLSGRPISHMPTHGQ